MKIDLSKKTEERLEKNMDELYENLDIPIKDKEFQRSLFIEYILNKYFDNIERNIVLEKMKMENIIDKAIK